MIKQGILLAGGLGKRLGKFTQFIANKHLYPVDDRLVIDFPLNTLKSLGVENLIVVIGGDFYSGVVDYLQDGAKWGMNISYIYQSSPNGISGGINLCRLSLQQEPFAVLLADNWFSEPIKYLSIKNEAQIFLQPIDPKQNERYKEFGVATIDWNRIINIQEKPQTLPEVEPQSKGVQFGIITGCYIFDSMFFEYFKRIKPSARNEFEVVDIINCYLKDGNLTHSFIDGEWSDMGKLSSIERVREKLRNNIGA